MTSARNGGAGGAGSVGRGPPDCQSRHRRREGGSGGEEGACAGRGVSGSAGTPRPCATSGWAATAVVALAKIMGFVAMGERPGSTVDMMFHGERLGRQNDRGGQLTGDKIVRGDKWGSCGAKESTSKEDEKDRGGYLIVTSIVEKYA